MLSKPIVFAAATSLIALLPALAQNSDFEQKRAAIRAQFDQMRAQHRAMLSPQGQRVLDRMDVDRQARQLSAHQALQNRIAQAHQLKVSPSQCALAFNAAIANAHQLSDLDPYFSSRMREMHQRSPHADREFADLKRAFIFDCKPRGKDSIKSNGESDVWLEGYNSSHDKGIWLNLLLVPEDNYWRIDSYKSQTGLKVIKFSVPAL